MKRFNQYGKSLGFFAALLAATTSTHAREIEETTWSAEAFAYERPTSLDVREGPHEIKNNIAEARQQSWTFKNVHDDEVTVLVTTPEKRGPWPVVILVHGFASHAQQVTGQVGAQLIEAGFACVALDLPRHGERKGVPKEVFEGTPDDVRKYVIQAVTDIRQTIDMTETMMNLDTSKGVILLGYSAGTWYTTLAGVADQRVKAMALVSAGSTVLDRQRKREGAEGLLFRDRDVRPIEAIGHFAPRPLLMINGKKDPLVEESQVRRLFTAANAPKELRWYDRGHLLPVESAKEIANWLRRRWRTIEKQAAKRTLTQPGPQTGQSIQNEPRDRDR